MNREASPEKKTPHKTEDDLLASQEFVKTPWLSQCPIYKFQSLLVMSPCFVILVYLGDVRDYAGSCLIFA